MIIQKTFQEQTQTLIFEQTEIEIGRPYEDEQGMIHTPHVNLEPDEKTSRRHARIVRVGDDFYIEDLGSTRGVLVQYNNQTTKISPNTPTLLQAEHIIRLADTQLSVLLKMPLNEATLHTPVIDGGYITNNVFITDDPADLIASNETLEFKAIRNHLQAFYRLAEELSSLQDIYALAETVTLYVHRAIQGVDSCGFLRHMDDGTLEEIGYEPRHKKPSYSTNLAKQTLDNREAFIWQKTANPTESQMFMSSAMYAPILWHGECLGVLFTTNTNQDHIQPFSDDDLRLLAALASQSAIAMNTQAMQEILRQEAIIRENLLHQFSPKVANVLLQQRDMIQLGHYQESYATILMSDVRGFTALSANMPPDEVIGLLNRMFSLITPIVFEYEGSIDKYIGDAVLAVFGSPIEDPQQALHAVQSAMAMQRALHELGDPFQIGVGIHFGKVVHGFIGSQQRMEYTVIGDTVNKTSRLCDGARVSEVLISESVYEQIRDWVQVEERSIKTKHSDTEGTLIAYKVLHLMC
jgi:class 3 adenylate cyclase/pSer/pThr/pTyr-binding forkhead associated (FHA) protein